MIAMGSLIVVSDSAKKSQALNFTMDNLNFAMESMSRSLRMGTNYDCGTLVFLDEVGFDPNCEGDSNLSFVPAKGSLAVRTAYRLELRENNTRTIQRCNATNGCVDIISTNIDIKELRFFVKGAEQNDLIQPSIYIIVRGSIIIKEEESSFSIQTMISQRTLE